MKKESQLQSTAHKVTRVKFIQYLNKLLIIRLCPVQITVIFSSLSAINIRSQEQDAIVALECLRDEHIQDSQSVLPSSRIYLLMRPHIRMTGSESNSGHRAVGLDTLIAPIKRELSGAQGNLLEERRVKLENLFMMENYLYREEMEKIGIALCEDI
uniref:Uncharacterized protein n=1 Tax=Glossina brevipalpis TaxID=37001 RepID=A0A1A9W2V5_9MUSC